MDNAFEFTFIFYCVCDEMLHTLSASHQVTLKIHFQLFFVTLCFPEAFKLSLTFFQSIDVLRVHSEQQAFVMQHSDEVVYVVGPVATRIQSLGQGEERLWVVGEVVNVENSFWVRDVVLFQVGVKACPWGSEKAQTF